MPKEPATEVSWRHALDRQLQLIRKNHTHFISIQAENQGQYQKTWPSSTLPLGGMALQPAHGSAGTTSRAEPLGIALLSRCQFVNPMNS